MAVPGMALRTQPEFDEFGNPIDPTMAPPPGAPAPAPAMLPDPTMNQVAPGTDPGSGGGGTLAPILGMPQEQSKSINTNEQKVASPATQKQLDQAVDATGRAQAARAADQTAAFTRELAVRAADENQASEELASEKQKATQIADAQRQRLEAEKAAQTTIAQAREQVDRDYATAGRNYWADRPMAAQIFAAIAVAASRRNQRIMGEDPDKSGVKAILDGAIDRDTKARMSTYLKSKQYLEDAQKLPGKAKEAYEAKLKQIQDSQAQELRIIAKEADVLKKSQKADPNAVLAEQQVLEAEADRKDAESMVKLLADYDRTGKNTRVDVDGQAGAGKPASEATRGLVTGSEQYDAMAARQKEIIAQSGGEIPIKGELAQEFETNDRKMAAILQRPLGKSDEDAKTAKKLQASPDWFDKARQEVGGLVGAGKQPVKNYLTSLDVNAKQLREEATSMARGEGKLAPGAGAGAKPAAPASKAGYSLQDATLGELAEALKGAAAAKNKAAVEKIQAEQARRRRGGK